MSPSRTKDLSLPSSTSTWRLRYTVPSETRGRALRTAEYTHSAVGWDFVSMTASRTRRLWRVDRRGVADTALISVRVPIIVREARESSKKVRIRPLAECPDNAVLRRQRLRPRRSRLHLPGPPSRLPARGSRPGLPRRARPRQPDPRGAAEVVPRGCGRPRPALALPPARRSGAAALGV